MAGDWIKMREDLRDSQEVRLLSSRLGKCRDTIVGKLHRFWVWVGRTTVDGRLPVTTEEMLDDVCECPSWTKGLIAVDWLRPNPKGGFVIPRWKSHNGECAKRRALTARRAARFRARCSNAGSVAERAPRAKQSEKTNERDSSSGSAAAGSTTKHASYSATSPIVLDRERDVIVRTLAGLRIDGKAVFTEESARVIAVHPSATYLQVKWAIERLTAITRRKGLPDSPGGFVRSLIETQEPPDSWLRRRRRAIGDDLQKQLVGEVTESESSMSTHGGLVPDQPKGG